MRLKNHGNFSQFAKSKSYDAKTAQKGRSISVWITMNGHVPCVSANEHAWNTINFTGKGNITEVLKVADKFYPYRVRYKKPEVQELFAIVKSEVEFDCRHFSEEREAQALLKRTLEHQEVEIYDSKFR